MLTKGEPDSDCFKHLLQPVASFWIVGEIIAGVAEFRTGKGLAPLASVGQILRGRSPAHIRSLSLARPFAFADGINTLWDLFPSIGGKS